MYIMKLEKLLEPFGFTFGQLQDIATFLERLRKRNIPIVDFVDYIEQEKERQVKTQENLVREIEKQKKAWERIAPKCLECDTTMSLSPVNTTPGNQTEDNSKSVWQCPNKDCLETVYDIKSVVEILKERRF